MKHTCPASNKMSSSPSNILSTPARGGEGRRGAGEGESWREQGGRRGAGAARERERRENRQKEKDRDRHIRRESLIMRARDRQRQETESKQDTRQF